MTRRVLAIVRKELVELRRDRITLSVAFLLPIMMLFLFGFAVSLDIRDVPLAVLDGDRSAESRRVVDALLETGDFSLEFQPENEREARRLLDAGEARLVVVFPPGFGRELRAGRPAVMQTLIDGTYSAHAAILRDETNGIALSVSRRLLAEALGGKLPGGIQPEPRVAFNAAMKTTTFVVPGLFAVILMAFPPLLTVLAVVRERESGSVQQIYVSPLRSWEFIAGKMLPYVLVAYAELGIVLLLGTLWFRIPFRGSPALLLAASSVYVFCTVGIGILVSTMTRSQVVGVILALVITIMPSLLFSGFMWPIGTMPTPMQWYTRLFPARYFNEISRGVFLKGVGLEVLWPELAVLGAYTVVVFTAASLRFKKKVA